MQAFGERSIRNNWFRFLFKHEVLLRKYMEQDLCTDSLVKVANVQLPWELVFKILDNLFSNYLYTFNYDLLIELLMVNKDFLRYKYRQIYETSQKASYVLYLRLRSTFRLLEDIHDNYIQSAIYTGNRKPYIRVESKRYRAVDPWEYRFDNVIVMYNDMRPITQSRLRSQPPPTYGTMVLLDTSPTFEINRIHYPLIDIIWSNQSGENNQTTHTLRNSNNFRKFGLLLKKVYAPFCRVQFVVPNVDDNPFLVNPNSFINIE